MRIIIIEPFMTGSHASWANGYQRHSEHEISILSLPGRHWKWRMHGAAITLAKKYKETYEGRPKPDLILATDMLDLPVFLGLVRELVHGIPVAMYFHENQLSYPWSPQDRDVKKGRDFHYGFINWASALSADAVYFNSKYNLDSFYDGVYRMLKAMPDNRHLDLIDVVKAKSEVLSLGINLSRFLIPIETKDYSKPVILWNHRWEYDKNPEDFFAALKNLKLQGFQFQLIVCGESYERYPPVFDDIKVDFANELIHYGYAGSLEDYQSLLQMANIIPVTNKQEFFGQSIMEAVASGCFPILPNALAYPEHIPDSLKQVLLYKTIEELQEKIADSAANLSSLVPIIETMQQVAMKYDWLSIIGQYDEVLLPPS